jgi:diaminopimelate epimerase
MGRRLVVEFTKMQGAGNDFLVIDNRFYRFSREELSSLAEQWCPRRFGVGADGLLALDAADAADYRMRYVNADGSPATMCGNGARCLARYAVAAGLGGPEVAFETDAGRYHGYVPDSPDAPVRLYVPSPRHFRRAIELRAPLPGPLEAVHYVWTGTEHLVAFVDALEAADVATWGRHLRTDARVQPEGANANFVRVEHDAEDRPRLRLRTYEKGVEGETLACGTGVLAAATVAWELGCVEADPVRVHAAGGTFRVGHEPTERGTELFLEGPAESVFRGSFEG